MADPQDNIQLDLGQLAGQVVQQQIPAVHKPCLHSRWNIQKFLNTPDRKRRTPFWHLILFAELMTLPGPTTGVTQSPTATLPTPSEFSLKNGYSPHWTC